jgi:hypothetical protein
MRDMSESSCAFVPVGDELQRDHGVLEPAVVAGHAGRTIAVRPTMNDSSKIFTQPKSRMPRRPSGSTR